MASRDLVHAPTPDTPSHESIFLNPESQAMVDVRGFAKTRVERIVGMLEWCMTEAGCWNAL